MLTYGSCSAGRGRRLGGRQHPPIPATRRRSPQIDAQRRRQAKKVVERFQWIGAGVVSVTLPVVDLLATAAVNAQMVVEIGRIYGCEFRARARISAFLQKPSEFGDYQGRFNCFNSAATECRHVCGWQGDSRSHGGLSDAHCWESLLSTRHDQDWGDGGMTGGDSFS